MLLLLKTSSAFPFVRTHVFGGLLKLDTFVSYLGLLYVSLLFGTLPLCSSLAFSSSQLRCSENPLIPRLVQVLLFHLYLVAVMGGVMWTPRRPPPARSHPKRIQNLGARGVSPQESLISEGLRADISLVFPGALFKGKEVSGWAEMVLG